jgi:hypothetical protein
MNRPQAARGEPVATVALFVLFPLPPQPQPRSAEMQNGLDFLRTQVDDAATAHALLLESVIYHEGEADDPRYRDLCDRHLPRMREHQLMLEELRGTLGVPRGSNPPAELVGVIRKAAGSAAGIVRSLADAPSSDYQRLSADLDLARRLEVTFKTFRDAGRALRIEGLARLGEKAERHHDDYSADAKRLLLQMFIERAQGAEVVNATIDSRVDSRIR